MLLALEVWRVMVGGKNTMYVNRVQRKTIDPASHQREIFGQGNCLSIRRSDIVRVADAPQETVASAVTLTDKGGRGFE
jgi:hypothetical protein